MRRGLIALLLTACGGSTPAPEPRAKPPAQSADEPERDAPSAVGTWRATLASPGGPLPFGLRIDGEPASLHAVAINGPEQVEFSSAKLDGEALVLQIGVYDSEIRATWSDDETLTGTWTKTTPKGPSSMDFTAQRGEAPRFVSAIEPSKYDVPASIAGNWSMQFSDEGDAGYVGQAVLVEADGRIDGTILTDTGDYRYLDGRYEQGTLELSCFDGGHAFLFRAQVQADGTLKGDFWSRASYHATFTAARMTEGDAGPLADPYEAVGLASGSEGRFRFSFPDLEGNVIADTDPRFSGKVVLVDVFGTWCPNCNDYAPLLAKWDERYRERGLEIVGLAFEMTGDVERDRTFVGRYAERYGLKFPLLLAGTSDKTDAAEALPSLDVVKSYPTTVFIGRDGKVHRIHSGFAGPATGEHHETMVAEMESHIETLLGPQ